MQSISVNSVEVASCESCAQDSCDLSPVSRTVSPQLSAVSPQAPDDHLSVGKKKEDFRNWDEWLEDQQPAHLAVLASEVSGPQLHARSA